MEFQNDRTCRACLKALSVEGRHLSDPIRSFYSKPSVTYLDAFVSCSGFSVEATEPQDICDECASELLITYQFREKCAKTQDEMGKWIESRVKKEEVEIKCEVFAESILMPKSEVVLDNVDDDDNVNYNAKMMAEEPVIHSVTEQKPKKVRAFQCDLCGRKYTAMSSLVQHYNLKHSKEKTGVCSFCNKSFYEQFLQGHTERCKRTPDQKGLCPICGVIRSDIHIKQHLEKEAHVTNPFICDICGNKFVTKPGLFQHIRIFHLKVMFKCRHCPEEFRTTQLLDTHIRKIHPEFKPLLKCEFCDYTTVYHSSLRLHRAIHTGNKPHQCPICHRAFKAKKILRDHLATHSDARPHICSICRASFKTRRNLLVHKKVHREHDYECPVCLRTFSSNQLVTLHAKSKHPEYQMPPKGTIMNKSYRKKMAEKKLKEEALRKGMDKRLVEAIKVIEPPAVGELELLLMKSKE